MELHVKRLQKPRQGGLLSGKNVRLILEVKVALSEQDEQLIETYYDPHISWINVAGGRTCIREYYNGTDEAFKVVKVDSAEGKLSRFHLIAHVDDGHSYLGNMQKFETAVVAALVNNLSIWRR